MRLHLNKTLRAALIVAITTVGFTLTQAQAVTLTEIASMNQLVNAATEGTASASTTWEIAGSAVYDFDRSTNCYVGGISITELNNALTGSDYVTVAAWINSASHGKSDDGHSIFGFGGQGNGIKVIDQDGKLKMTTKGKTDYATSAVGIGLNEWELVAVTFHKNGNSVEAKYMLDGQFSTGISTGTYSAPESGFTFAIGSGNGSASRELFVGSIGDLTVFTSSDWATYEDVSALMSSAPTEIPATEMTWNGTGEPAVWDTQTANWLRGETLATYVSSPNTDAIFGTTGVKAVSVSGAIAANRISVQDTYSFAIGDGASITASKLTITGTSLTVTGVDGNADTVTIGTLTGTGNLTAGADSNVTVSTVSDYTGELGVANGGTLTVGFSINKETLTIAGGTLNLGGNRHTIGTLTIGEGGLVTTTRHDGSGCVSGDIDIKAGGTFRVAGQHDAFGWGGNATKNIILTGESETKRAELQFQQTTGNSATFATNLKLMGHALVSTTKNGFNTYGGSIYAEGVDNTIQKFQLRSAATIEVKESGELTVGEMVYGNDGTHNLTKTGAGTLTFTGTANMQALNLQDGSLVIAGGTTTVAGNSASTLNKTIAVNAGSLVLRGTYEIGGNTGEMETTYVGGATEGNGNGFEHVAGSSTVYTKAEGATVNVEGATFTVGGRAVTLEDGVYTTEGSTNFGTFYVKSGTESLAHAIQYAQGATVSTVSLANGTTINTDSAGASIGLVLASGVSSATVNATAATTISSISGWSGSSLTITGGAAVSILPGQDIVIGDNTTLTVDTTVNAQKVQLNGTDASLVVTDGGTLTTSNNLTLTKGKADINGTVNVGHEVDLSNGSKSTATLHIHGGGDVTVKDGMWMATSAVGVLLDEDATLAITGKGVIFTGKEGGNGSIKASGAEVNYTTNNGNAVITNLVMEATGDITIGNTLNNVDVVTGEHGVTLNAAANGVTVSTDGSISIGAAGSAAAITVEDGGVIGSYTKTNTGETTVASLGTAILADVIDLQAGKLTMTGSYNIDYLYGDVEVSEYEGGIVDGNGFAHETGTIQVVDITAGAELDISSGKFIRGGNELQLTDGTAEVDATNYGTFYIFTETETVTTAKNIADQHGGLSTIYVEESATLDVDQNINGSLVDTGSSGTVSIREGKTVTGTMEGVALVGSGTYVLGSGSSNLGSATLGDTWTGTVKVTKNDLANLDLNTFGKEGSIVEIDGWSKHLNNTDATVPHTYNPKLRLGTGGLTIADGYSGRTYIFAGGVEGAGNFMYNIASSASDQTYAFTGDVSQWTGAYQSLKDGKTSTLKFYGDATEVNAAIQKTAGTLNLEVGNGADTFSTVFNESVSASSITVKANASAEFTTSITADAITVAEGGALNIHDTDLATIISNGGSVTLTDVALDDTVFTETDGESAHFGLNGKVTEEANYFEGISANYVQVVNGGTSSGSGLIWGDGGDYELTADGKIITGEDVIDYGTFYVNADAVRVSDIAAAAHNTTAVEVAGGTLDVDQAASGLAITVTNEGTLTGDALDVTQVGIIQYATALFEQGIQNDHVKISSEGEAVEVLNLEATAKYSLSNSAMVVTAGSIEKISAGDDVTVSNLLYVDDIVNIQGGALTLNGQEDAMTVKNLTIGQNSTVEVTDQSGTELTITVEETLAAAGNATLLANLEMADGSALLLEGVQKGVSIGSTLTMNTGIMLDEATLSALDGMDIGDTFWLIGAVDGKPMEYDGEYGEDAWYGSVFSRTAYDSNYELGGDFNIMFSETDGFGLQKFSNTPEPTTGTLSLLALAALAARRRRK